MTKMVNMIEETKTEEIEETKTPEQAEGGNVESQADAPSSEEPNDTAQPDYADIVNKQAARIEEQSDQISRLISQIDALIRNGVPVNDRTAGDREPSAAQARNPAFGDNGKHEGVKPMDGYTFEDFKI